MIDAIRLGLEFRQFGFHGLTGGISTQDQVHQHVDALLYRIAFLDESHLASTRGRFERTLLTSELFQVRHQIALTVCRLLEHIDDRFFPRLGGEVRGFAALGFQPVRAPQVEARQTTATVGGAAGQHRSAMRASCDALEWPHAIDRGASVERLPGPPLRRDAFTKRALAEFKHRAVDEYADQFLIGQPALQILFVPFLVARVADR